MTSSYAYLLVFHGSRDCRTQTAALNLRNLLIAKKQSKNILTQHNYLEKNHNQNELESTTFQVSLPTPLIEIAALELADLSLSESIINFAERSSIRGFKQIKVVPLFLAPGVHVQSDIPTEIDLANKRISDRVTIELSPYLGKDSEIINLLSQQFEDLDERPIEAQLLRGRLSSSDDWEASLPPSKLLRNPSADAPFVERRKETPELGAKTRILIAHGSKLLSVAKYYRELGLKLNADLAYWSTEPRFTQQIKAKIAAGCQKIALVPYFLFPGRITEAISQEISVLQEEYPQIELQLGKPLGETSAIADLIARKL